MEIERVVGAPGTGKTSYLMTRLEELKDDGVDAEQIGLFSFSKAANRESVSRAAALYDCEPEELSRDGFFRTIHSAAYKIGEVSEGELLTDNKESVEWISNTLGVPIGTRVNESESGASYVGGHRRGPGAKPLGLRSLDAHIFSRCAFGLARAAADRTNETYHREI